MVLNIFTSARHRGISAFLYRTSFLDCGFARRQKGPDLLNGRDRNLIREIWSYQWSGSVMAALIDHSVSGATVEEACKRELEEGMARAAAAEEGARLMVWSFLMGLSGEGRDFGGQMEELLAADGDFFSQGKACASLNTLCRLRTLYRQEGKGLERLLEMCFVKLSQLLPSMTRIRDEQLTDCIQVCALLYELTGRKEFAGRREELMETFEAMAGTRRFIPGFTAGCWDYSTAETQPKGRRFFASAPGISWEPGRRCVPRGIPQGTLLHLPGPGPGSRGIYGDAGRAFCPIKPGGICLPPAGAAAGLQLLCAGGGGPAGGKGRGSPWGQRGLRAQAEGGGRSGV